MVRADFGINPFQDDVCGRDGDHASGISIEGVLAGQERFTPHTPAAFLPVHRDGTPSPNVGAGSPGVRNRRAHIRSLDNGLRDHFYGSEQAIDIVRAFHQHL